MVREHLDRGIGTKINAGPRIQLEARISGRRNQRSVKHRGVRGNPRAIDPNTRRTGSGRNHTNDWAVRSCQRQRAHSQ